LKILVCGISAVVFLACSAQRGKPPNSVLAKLTLEERYLLEAFLLRCLWNAPAAYVVFGDKPAAIIGWRRTPGHSLLAFSAKSSIYIEGYRVWKKCRGSLPLSKKYLVLCKERVGGGEVSVTFINKKALFKAVREHIDAVREVLGPAMTAEKLLKRIEENHGLTLAPLARHQGLLGLLLGYGKRNSWLWQRRRDLERASERFSLRPKKALPSLSKEAMEEIASIKSRLQLFGNEAPSPLRLLGLPVFAADLDDPESQELLDRYKKQRREIVQTYREGNFLEATIRQLCSE